MSSPFDFVDDISGQRKNLIDIGEKTESDYDPYLINTSLSYHPACILYVNAMNELYNLDHKLQYDFYLNAIHKGSVRRVKWGKKNTETVDRVKQIATRFKISPRQARAVMSMVDDKEAEVK